jgi:putative ABC transport system substrate-binding protein
VTARAARKVTRDIPIVYAVVVDPVSDGLATVSRQPLGNMTGMTTYDPDQARMHIALLRSVKPNLARIALLADSGVSNCLVQAHSHAMQEAGLRPQVVRIAGPDPDLKALSRPCSAKVPTRSSSSNIQSMGRTPHA